MAAIRPITQIQPLIVIQPMTEYFQPLVLYYLVILLAVLFVYSCYISLLLLYLVQPPLSGSLGQDPFEFSALNARGLRIFRTLILLASATLNLAG